MESSRPRWGRSPGMTVFGRTGLAAAALVGIVASSMLAGTVSAVSYATPAPTSAAATSAPSAGAAASAPASLSLGGRMTALGDVLTGPNGMTLYTLSSDPNGGSVCTGQCLVFWPPLLVAPGGAVSGPSTVSGTFATFVRADDGSTQVTLDGRALYYFKNDTAPGQTNGEGIKGAGGVWHVVLAAAAAASAGATGSVAGVTTTPRVTIPPTSTAPSGTPSGGDPLPLLAVLFIVSAGAVTLRFAARRERGA